MGLFGVFPFCRMAIRDQDTRKTPTNNDNFFATFFLSASSFHGERKIFIKGKVTGDGSGKGKYLMNTRAQTQKKEKTKQASCYCTHTIFLFDKLALMLPIFSLFFLLSLTLSPLSSYYSSKEKEKERDEKELKARLLRMGEGPT